MATATNTTLGEIVLGGDLTGAADSPQLISTGVTPGTYAPLGRIVVDAKGRVLAIGSVTQSEVLSSVGTASAVDRGIVQVGANINVSSGTISVPDASSSVKGAFRLDTTMTITAGDVSVNYANIPDGATSSKGIVRVGSGLSSTAGVLSVDAKPDATTSTKGIVQVGSGLAISSGILRSDVPDATTSSKGAVQVGSGLNVASGVMSIPGTPDATTAIKGLVQVGTGLTVSSGIVSADPIPDATTSSKGVVQVGAGLAVSSGILSVQDATTSSKGLVQIGDGLNVASGVISRTMPNTTTTSKGVVQVGAGFDISSGVVSLPDATTSSVGLIQVGSGLNVASGVLSAPVTPDATLFSPGIVQIGDGLSISGGILSTADATTSSKGLVQIGDDLSVSSGVVSANIPDATTSSKGLVQVGSGLSVSSGTLYISDASIGTLAINSGVVQPGLGFRINPSTSELECLTNVDATRTSKGIVQIGSGLNVSAGSASVITGWGVQPNAQNIYSAAQQEFIATPTLGPGGVLECMYLESPGVVCTSRVSYCEFASPGAFTINIGWGYYQNPPSEFYIVIKHPNSAGLSLAGVYLQETAVYVPGTTHSNLLSSIPNAIDVVYIKSIGTAPAITWLISSVKGF